MRTPDRDRRRQGLIALGIALILCTLPAAALTAEYTVFPNGTAYEARIEVEDASSYEFVEIGILGERVPTPVNGISVTNASGEVAFEQTGTSRIGFPEGNHTIRYVGTVRSTSFQAVYDRPYAVTVRLPPTFDVGNPLLGYVSSGGEVTYANESAVIRWEAARFVEVRFYDDVMERALVIFGTLWMALCVIFLFPYLMMWLRDRR